MWTRAELKKNAKQVLRGTFVSSLLVSVLTAFLSGGGGGASGGASSSVSQGFVEGNEWFGFAMLFIVLIIIAIALAFSVFVSNPILFGKDNFFLKAAKGDAKFTNVFSAFSNGHYKNIVIIMFLKGLYTFLWSLLFIVPGVIKSYQYSMIPYLLSENPGMSTEEAFELSKRMTDGEKMNMFILDLSFIGWYILGCIACFIGTVFVAPYFEATRTQLYLVLREKVEFTVVEQ